MGPKKTPPILPLKEDDETYHLNKTNSVTWERKCLLDLVLRSQEQLPTSTNFFASSLKARGLINSFVGELTLPKW
jgi:hypothetical protein